jgi:hypothetical protein
MASEFPVGFTADGQLVVGVTTTRNQIMKVVVAELLAGAGSEKP